MPTFDDPKGELYRWSSALELSEDDIRRIYYAAVTGDPSRKRTGDLVAVLIGESFSIFLLLVKLLAMSSGPQVDAVGLLFLVGVPYWLLAGFMMLRYRVVGPISYILEASRQTRDEVERKVDVYSPKVLKIVLDHVVQPPLKRHEALRQEIQGSMDRIVDALGSLRHVTFNLRKEMVKEDDASVKLLIQSRLDSAIRTEGRLNELKSQLDGQIDAVDEAILPMQKLVDSFKRILAVTNDMETIQAAHGLADDQVTRVREYRLQIDALRQSMARTMGQLSEIETIVLANQLARDEVLALGSEG